MTWLKRLLSISPSVRFERPAGVRDLTTAELRHIGTTGTCLYCNEPLAAGPEAGMCVNLLCATEGCWARYNYCGFVGQYMGVDKSYWDV